MKFHTRALRKSASAERILAIVRASGGRQVDSQDCAGAGGGKKPLSFLGGAGERDKEVEFRGGQ